MLTSRQRQQGTLHAHDEPKFIHSSRSFANPSEEALQRTKRKQAGSTNRYLPFQMPGDIVASRSSAIDEHRDTKNERNRFQPAQQRQSELNRLNYDEVGRGYPTIPQNPRQKEHPIPRHGSEEEPVLVSNVQAVLPNVIRGKTPRFQSQRVAKLADGSMHLNVDVAHAMEMLKEKARTGHGSLRSYLKNFDQNRDGFLAKPEITTALLSLELGFTKDEADRIADVSIAASRENTQFREWQGVVTKPKHHDKEVEIVSWIQRLSRDDFAPFRGRDHSKTPRFVVGAGDNIRDAADSDLSILRLVGDKVHQLGRDFHKQLRKSDASKDGRLTRHEFQDAVQFLNLGEEGEDRLWRAAMPSEDSTPTVDVTLFTRRVESAAPWRSQISSAAPIVGNFALGYDVDDAPAPAPQDVQIEQQTTTTNAAIDSGSGSDATTAKQSAAASFGAALKTMGMDISDRPAGMPSNSIACDRPWVGGRPWEQQESWRAVGGGDGDGANQYFLDEVGREHASRFQCDSGLVGTSARERSRVDKNRIEAISYRRSADDHLSRDFLKWDSSIYGKPEIEKKGRDKNVLIRVNQPPHARSTTAADWYLKQPRYRCRPQPRNTFNVIVTTTRDTASYGTSGDWVPTSRVPPSESQARGKAKALTDRSHIRQSRISAAEEAVRSREARAVDDEQRRMRRYAKVSAKGLR